MSLNSSHNAMHKSVLLQEIIDLTAPKVGDVFIDATVGAGGHTIEILRRIGPTGRLLVIDRDENALKIARENLEGKNAKFFWGNFNDLAEIARETGFTGVNGIIFDLGVSSMQLDESQRGFSFSKHARLDMRMDKSQKLTAEEVVNTYSEKELARIFREYGEEKAAKRVARGIVRQREQGPIIWTDQLSEVVGRVKTKINRNSAIANRKFRVDPATKIFQALRIEVNGELSALESALPQAVSLLAPKGKMAVISFHSLEDRIVKQFVEDQAKGCKCPPEFPKCVCGARPELKKITKKPVMPSEKEIKENPRSRSAKLRVAEKL